MDIGYYRIDETTNAVISGRIADKASFVIECCNNAQYTRTLEWVESEIGRQKMSVRVYTRNRAAAMSLVAVAWIPGVGAFAAAGAALTGIGIAAHNLVTINPDWEIGKDRSDFKLYVDFKK